METDDGSGWEKLDLSVCSDCLKMLQILSPKNLGLRPAAGITATLTTSCANVVIVDEASLFTDIPVDSVSDNRGWPFIFYQKGSATDHIIPFRLWSVIDEGLFLLTRSWASVS
ncbi:MAG: hypothetical protein ACE5OR_06080 [bacterium]